MKKTLLICAALLLLLCVAVVFVWRSARPEPVWQGRTLTAWTADLAFGSSIQIRGAAEEAVQAIGTNAIPHFVRMLRERHTLFKQVLLDINGLQPVVQFSVIDESWQHLCARLGFEALGEKAESALPQLRELLLRDPNGELVPEVLAGISSNCVPLLLDALPHVGPGRRCAIMAAVVKWPSQENLIRPALRNCLVDSNLQVRTCAASFLGRCGSDSRANVPILIAALNDPELAVRAEALTSLASFGTDAATALPVLRELSRRSNAFPLGSLSNAIRRIEPNR